MSAASVSPPRTLILMGVCGCGKTLIGSRLAEALGGVFEDADDFHTVESKAKMRAGTPLTDDDRRPWFDLLRARIEGMREQTPVYVLACSALKAVYRDRLRGPDGPEDLVFLHLKGSRELIFGRMSAREGHYMPVSLLDSQLAILEETPDLWMVDIGRKPEAIAADILDRLAAPRS